MCPRLKYAGTHFSSTALLFSHLIGVIYLLNLYNQDQPVDVAWHWVPALPEVVCPFVQISFLSNQQVFSLYNMPPNNYQHQLSAASCRDCKAQEKQTAAHIFKKDRTITHHLPGCSRLTKIERTLSWWVPSCMQQSSSAMVMTDSWEACRREDASVALCCMPFSKQK